MKKYWLVLIIFLSSCVSIEQATENSVYIGMTKRNFCKDMSLTSIPQDPCFGSQTSIGYNSYRNMEILSPSDRSLYFVFKNVDYRTTSRGSGGGVLATVTRNYDIALRALNTGEIRQEQRIVEAKAANENKLIEVSSGTGFFVSDQGYFISNNHVVEICREVKTKQEGRTYQANIIAVDTKNDLALGKIDYSNNEYLTVSDDGAMLGEDIIVAGFPFQKQLSESIKITKGIISSLSGPGNDYTIFQMDAAVQPGNSGGPIINNQGKIVGITLAKADSEAFYEMTGSLPENINFGIKVEILKPFLEANKIRQPWSFFSSDDLMTSVELASRASDTTIHLQCWNTMAALREIVKDNKVRNLLVDIE